MRATLSIYSNPHTLNHTSGVVVSKSKRWSFASACALMRRECRMLRRLIQREALNTALVLCKNTRTVDQWMGAYPFCEQWRHPRGSRGFFRSDNSVALSQIARSFCKMDDVHANQSGYCSSWHEPVTGIQCPITDWLAARASARRTMIFPDAKQFI